MFTLFYSPNFLYLFLFSSSFPQSLFPRCLWSSSIPSITGSVGYHFSCPTSSPISYLLLRFCCLIDNNVFHMHPMCHLKLDTVFISHLLYFISKLFYYRLCNQPCFIQIILSWHLLLRVIKLPAKCFTILYFFTSILINSVRHIFS